MKKDDLDINSIVNEYKMSMGGSFFSKAHPAEDNKQSEHLIVEDVLKNHLFDIQKLLNVYDELSYDKKRELFYRAILSLINLYGE
jgi:hypothetical protein